MSWTDWLRHHPLRYPSGAFRGVPGDPVPIHYFTPRGGHVILHSSRCMGVERLSNPAWRQHVINRMNAAGMQAW